MTTQRPTTDPRFSEIESHRPYLVRYALAQLRDRALAEEAVQEALLAALESIGTFGGKSSLRTWLTSILRFKVIDLQRRAVAERAHEEYDEGIHSEDDGWLTSILRFKVIDLQRRAVAERVHEEYDEGTHSEDDGWLDELFDSTGHWREAPQSWGNPQAALEQRRFWEAFERCLGRLPQAGSRVFFKREVLGEDTEAICKDEGITASNCWVILHRSRLALRACLEKNWFGKDAGGQ